MLDLALILYLVIENYYAQWPTDDAFARTDGRAPMSPLPHLLIAGFDHSARTTVVHSYICETFVEMNSLLLPLARVRYKIG